MRMLFLILIISVGCLDLTDEKSIDKLSLYEVGQRINGGWKLKSVQTRDEIRYFSMDSDKINHFEIDELNGVMIVLTDNHDGTYGVSSQDPFCQLLEKDKRKIIEYAFFLSSTEEEIIKVTDNELVLTDSLTTWTYVRHELKEFD